MLLYMSQEGRGIGLVNKLKAYELQDHGADTVEANERLGFPADLRDYGIGAQILADLGVRQMRLMTNNPKKMVGLDGYGLSVVERVPLEIPPCADNEAYLRTKCTKMGHLLSQAAKAVDRGGDMAKVIEGTLNAKGMRVALVAGRFNDFITSKLVEGALDTLKRHGAADQNLTVVWVPGAFEIPLVARKLAAGGKYDAVITLGAVIRGATSHFDYVAAEVSKGVAQAGLDTGVPVIFGVLTTDSIEQAIERGRHQGRQQGCRRRYGRHGNGRPVQEPLGFAKVGERRKSRELALKVLYQMEHGDATAQEALASFADNFAAPKRLWVYAQELVNGIAGHAGEIDQALAEVSRRWRVERMSRVDRNILRLACYEMRFSDGSVPPKVAINESGGTGQAPMGPRTHPDSSTQCWTPCWPLRARQCRPPAPSIICPSDKQDRILDEALSEFAAKGYARASLNRLVSRLGIAKGSIFKYFRDKPGLFSQVFDFAVERVKRHLRRCARRHPRPGRVHPPGNEPTGGPGDDRGQPSPVPVLPAGHVRGRRAFSGASAGLHPLVQP